MHNGTSSNPEISYKKTSFIVFYYLLGPFVYHFCPFLFGRCWIDKVWFGLVWFLFQIHLHLNNTFSHIFFRYQFVSPDSETSMQHYMPDRASKQTIVIISMYEQILKVFVIFFFRFSNNLLTMIFVHVMVQTQIKKHSVVPLR